MPLSLIPRPHPSVPRPPMARFYLAAVEKISGYAPQLGVGGLGTYKVTSGQNSGNCQYILSTMAHKEKEPAKGVHPGT